MWTTLIACAIFIQCVGCLRLVRLDVPHAIVNGDPIWLNCSFDLEMDELYSVKWYKNNVEFYRYLPNDETPAQKYDLLGVNLDLKKSNKGHIYLQKTDLNSEGTYRCEVSAEAPSFQTVREEKEMRIYVKPETGPTILGIRTHYGVGEEINVTCLAGPSKPPSLIKWYINGREPPPKLMLSYSPKRYKTGLLSSRVGLQFMIQSDHYWHGAMKMGCVAVFSQIYFIGSEEMIITNKPSVSGFKSAPGYGRDGPTISGGDWKYEVGDIIDLNCTSIMDPPPQLQWLINDVMAPPESIIKYKTDGSKVRSILGLRFALSRHHYVDDQLRLNCTAKLSKVVHFREDKTVLASSQHTSGLQMSDNNAAAVHIKEEQKFHYIITLFLLCLQLFRLS